MVAHSNSQFIALKQRSQETQSALSTAHQTLQTIEETLADFLDDYYAKVGGAFETLTQLQQELAECSSACFDAPMSPLPDASAKRASQAGEIKQLYREMVRDCHPDQYMSGGGEVAALKAEMMKTLNAAYARKSLSDMWQIMGAGTASARRHVIA